MTTYGNFNKASRGHAERPDRPWLLCWWRL